MADTNTTTEAAPKTSIFTKILKSKTIIVMVALGALPVLDLMGTIDLTAILSPILCGADVLKDECKSAADIQKMYTAGVAGAAVVLRFLTTGSIKSK